MTSLEIAQKLAGLGAVEDACKAYKLALQEEQDATIQMEAAVHILQFGKGEDYKISYTLFRDLYNQGIFQENILEMMDEAFYQPNIRALKTRYEKNCKLLSKYPYLFRKDFPAFEDLPIRFYPYDDDSYTPYIIAEKHFGEYINLKDPKITRNFFKDLENPILAKDVYSQYELEYLRDNVRKSEDVARENHIYLHYSSWPEFCAYLTCLNLRPLLEEQKLVFLFGEEIAEYPINFEERFGIDYGKYTLQPVRVREVTRLIWHTQLATHNGGDFFNEIFDGHPNLLAMPSMMMYNVEEMVEKVRTGLRNCQTLADAVQAMETWKNPKVIEELYHNRSRTDKDILVALFLCEETASSLSDKKSRIVPAVFFQPHFHNMSFQLEVNTAEQAMLYSPQYEQIRTSPLFQGFKYIKTFTPMRRITTSYGATVKFMQGEIAQRLEEKKEKEKNEKSIVNDSVSERVLNRSFMIDWQDRLYHDSVLVRFEDGKLNPKATFTALAAFLDLPYTESLTYCSLKGERDPESLEGNDLGFSPAAIYRTYDDYANDSERCFIEYFMRDAYEYYGYDFLYYDGGPMDMERAEELISDFAIIDDYITKSWEKVFAETDVSQDGRVLGLEEKQAVKEKFLKNYMEQVQENRKKNAAVLLRGLRFINRNGQPLQMMPRLQLDPALLEQPLYH